MSSAGQRPEPAEAPLRTGPGPSGSEAVTRRGAAPADGRAQRRLWPPAEAWPTPGEGAGGTPERSLPAAPAPTSANPEQEAAESRAREFMGSAGPAPGPPRCPRSGAAVAATPGGALRSSRCSRGRGRLPCARPALWRARSRGRGREAPPFRGAARGGRCATWPGSAALRAAEGGRGRRSAASSELGVSVRLVSFGSPSVALDT